MIRSNNPGSRNAVVLVNYCTLMDAVFFLNEADRTNLLQLLMQSFGCTYICLWSYIPHPFNGLIFHDGCYKEEGNQPSSPTGTLAWRLFLEYQQTPIPIENDSRVPGFAFRNNRSYFELRDLDLQRLSSNDTQRQFYLEARIKVAVFMGFSAGEIELGFSNETQINIEMGIREFFPEDFWKLPPPPPPPPPLRLGLGELPQQLTVDPNPTMAVSSSSSSLRSLSTGSPMYSSLIFNLPSSSHIATETTGRSTSLPPISRRTATAATNPHHQAMQALSQIQTIPLPSEHATTTQAFSAVLTSPSSSSTSTLHHRPQPNMPYNYQLNPKTSAFKRYATPGPLAPTTPQTRASLREQNMLNRSLLYYKSLHAIRRQLGLGSGSDSHPTSTQLHHIMLERKRRKKLNESIQTLKSLLPPGTKKDKISVLNSTRECLSSLIARVSELSRKNQLLETQLLRSKEAVEEVVETSSNERTNVRIIHASESTSEERFIDLRISVRGECCVMVMLIRLLEFLKQDRNVSLVSMEANTTAAEPGPSNNINFRLRIEGDGWDESAFTDAVRRLTSSKS